MGSFPTSPRAAFLAWCQAHVNVFLDQTAAIGLTAEQAQKFAGAVSDALSTSSAQEEARLAYRASITANTDRFRELRRGAAEMVRTIRTFAENENNPNVYALAQIPAPQPAGVAPPPGKPGDVRVNLDPATGAIELRWASNNPQGTSGTSYIVRRRVGSTGEFSFLGVSGTRRFVDHTFVAGPDSVQYTIQGQRADAAGPTSDVVTVNFGRQGGGGIFIAHATNASFEPRANAA